MTESGDKNKLMQQGFAAWLEGYTNGGNDTDKTERRAELFLAFCGGWKAAEDADLWGDE